MEMTADNSRKELSFRYIRGEGIEIGALHQSLPVPPNVTVHYVDRMDYEGLLEQYPEIPRDEIIPADIIDDAASLSTIPDKSWDFCICNHVLEHMRDPVGSFIQWLRVLKPGGILYLSVPDAKNPLDCGRPLTPLQHMIGDYAAASEANDRRHYLECAKYWSRTTDEKAAEIAESRWSQQYSIHYHVFDQALIIQLLEYIRSLKIGFCILSQVENEINGVQEYIFIIEKTGYAGEIVRVLEQYPHVSPEPAAIIDVVVPVFNAYEDTCRCLYSLLKHRDIYRIVLVNDCSTDERIPALLETIRLLDSPAVRVITNPENRGFVRSVNAGMRFSNNDVILLNSDTIVTEGWADKIRTCAYSAPDIATVTPFTNNGTICSIPEFCRENRVPQGFTIDGFGRFVEELSFRHYPSIPTAVGFCMFIRRNVLVSLGFFDEDAFDWGYCEENDFCMRAKRAGYTNRLCDDTFVYHKGESSFCGTRSQRLEKNQEILSGRYPEYLPLVRQFCARDPLLHQREYFRVKLTIWSDHRAKKRVLYVLHSLGGGTEKQVGDLMDSLKKTYAFFIAQVFEDELVFTEVNNGERIRYYFPMRSFAPSGASDPEYREIMRKFIAGCSIDLIHVHHLMGHSFDIFRIGSELGIPVLFTVHDFFSLCPTINLLDENGRYCNLPALPSCNRCMKKTFGHDAGFLESWRSLYRDGFSLCDHLIAPSRSATEILTRCYPDVEQKCRVIPHGYDAGTGKEPAPAMGDYGTRAFHIAYIGNLAYHKGREIFYTLAGSRDLSGITRWSVLGISDLHREAGYYPENNVTITGPFLDFSHLRQLVRENKIDLILLPAIWPETYSFTLSEAWDLGIPVLGSDLGAIGERIRKTGGGWTVDISDTRAVQEKILAIIRTPAEYREIQKKISAIRPLSKAVIAGRYDQLYKETIRAPGQDSGEKFDNTVLYTARQSIKSVAEPAGEGTGNRFLPAQPAGNPLSQFIVCLQEHGLRYTIRRVWVYWFPR
jgi:GT2 family glycosyltransferase/glycosyltransferase involved in cell wall biosynthesis/SAM-dependent methyltransferase